MMASNMFSVSVSDSVYILLRCHSIAREIWIFRFESWGFYNSCLSSIFIYLTCVNSKSDYINSDAPADPSEADISSLMVSNPQDISLNPADLAQNPVSVDNVYASNTDQCNSAVTANLEGCGTNGSQTNKRFRE